MNILVTESEPKDAERLADELERRGHLVRRCASTRNAPCVALEPGGRCPLDEHTFDLMVDVRLAALPRLTVHEYGALCALRQDLPLVVVGPPGADRPLPWAERTVGAEDVDAVLAVVGNRERLLAEAVERAVRRTYAARVGVGTVDVRVSVDQHGHRVVIGLPQPPGALLRDALESAARVALGAHDTHWQEADISFRSPAVGQLS